MDKKKQRKCPLYHTFRCSEETQAMLESLMEQTLYSKSELIRECITAYYNVCKEGLDG